MKYCNGGRGDDKAAENEGSERERESGDGVHADEVEVKERPQIVRGTLDDPLSPGLFMRISPLHVSFLGGGGGGGGDIGLSPQHLGLLQKLSGCITEARTQCLPCSHHRGYWGLTTHDREGREVADRHIEYKNGKIRKQTDKQKGTEEDRNAEERDGRGTETKPHKGSQKKYGEAVKAGMELSARFPAVALWRTPAREPTTCVGLLHTTTLGVVTLMWRCTEGKGSSYSRSLGHSVDRPFPSHWRQGHSGMPETNVLIGCTQRKHKVSVRPQGCDGGGRSRRTEEEHGPELLAHSQVASHRLTGLEGHSCKVPDRAVPKHPVFSHRHVESIRNTFCKPVFLPTLPKGITHNSWQHQWTMRTRKVETGWRQIDGEVFEVKTGFSSLSSPI
ncbi:hypothetical protein EYF80_013423 [Liparis tanakae]|uniref:Uncharacterized protein n=1 Tax=Liparis tanakae TaxID=230148 RepID=A0A4Z2IG05_9TELE|nr:hypothetical protein EYF80_013423 [Liparis tanakae]